MAFLARFGISVAVQSQTSCYCFFLVLRLVVNHLVAGCGSVTGLARDTLLLLEAGLNICCHAAAGDMTLQALGALRGRLLQALLRGQLLCLFRL